MSKIPNLPQLKKVLEQAKAFGAGLLSEFSIAAADAIEEVEAAKADKYSATAVTIPTTDWTSDTSVPAYPYYYDISAAGITTNDRADVVIAQTSLAAAKQCGLCATSETLAGKIRIRAAAKPTSNISAQYAAAKGKET